MMEQNYRKMNKARKDGWKCLECKNSKDITFFIPNNEGKKKSSDEDTEGLKEMFTNFTKEIKSQLNDFEKSLEYNSNQMDDVLKQVHEVKDIFKTMQKKQDEIIKENTMMRKEMDELKYKIQDLEQKSLDHNLEIFGVPDSIPESKAMESLCQIIQVTVPEASSFTAKRSWSGAHGKSKAICVQFQSKHTRDTILKKSKARKPKISDFATDSQDNRSVYINEQLSPYNKQLFYMANKIKMEKNYKFIWVAEGKILLKKTEDSKTIRVKCINDMN